MVQSRYDWHNQPLDEHTKCKHKVLREYLAEYLRIRCQFPQQGRFRIAVIDGFCGAARYKKGQPGSPAIILQVFKEASESINLMRAAHGFKPLQIDLLLILNDAVPEVIDLCKNNIAPLLGEIKENNKLLSITPIFLSQDFEEAYPEIKSIIKEQRYHSSVFFNLDQYGYVGVSADTIKDIMGSYRAPEILLTFAIQALVSYLPKSNQDALLRHLNHLDVKIKALGDIQGEITTNKEWLGYAEREIFNSLRGLANYTSPFAINNRDGWHYWLIHFAQNYRARQVYNDILHKRSNAQAHFGKSGLEMLQYDSGQEGSLYSFNDADRIRAKEQLFSDIPRAIANFRGGITVADFNQKIYNGTPAHSDDIKEAIINNEDIQVFTPKGAKRRKTVNKGDIIKLNPQRSILSVLSLNSTQRPTPKPNKPKERG